MTEQGGSQLSVLDRLRVIDPTAQGNKLAIVAFEHLTNPADIVNFVAEYSSLMLGAPKAEGDMAKAITIARKNIQWMLGYVSEDISDRWGQALGGVTIGSPLNATGNPRDVIHYTDAEDLGKKLRGWIDDNTTY